MAKKFTRHINNTDTREPMINVDSGNFIIDDKNRRAWMQAGRAYIPLGTLINNGDGDLSYLKFTYDQVNGLITQTGTHSDGTPYTQSYQTSTLGHALDDSHDGQVKIAVDPKTNNISYFTKDASGNFNKVLEWWTSDKSGNQPIPDKFKVKMVKTFYTSSESGSNVLKDSGFYGGLQLTDYDVMLPNDNGSYNHMHNIIAQIVNCTIDEGTSTAWATLTFPNWKWGRVSFQSSYIDPDNRNVVSFTININEIGKMTMFCENLQSHKEKFQLNMSYSFSDYNGAA